MPPRLLSCDLCYNSESQSCQLTWLVHISWLYKNASAPARGRVGRLAQSTKSETSRRPRRLAPSSTTNPLVSPTLPTNRRLAHTAEQTRQCPHTVTNAQRRMSERNAVASTALARLHRSLPSPPVASGRRELHLACTCGQRLCVSPSRPQQMTADLPRRLDYAQKLLPDQRRLHWANDPHQLTHPSSEWRADRCTEDSCQFKQMILVAGTAQ